MSFLVQRYEQLRALEVGPHTRKTVVADYIFEKDKLFANINLTDAELARLIMHSDEVLDLLEQQGFVERIVAQPSTFAASSVAWWISVANGEQAIGKQSQPGEWAGSGRGRSRGGATDGRQWPQGGHQGGQGSMSS